MKPDRGLFYGWVIILASFLTLFVATGARSSIGVFVKPLGDEFAWSRADISLAMSVHTLVQGVSQPLIGYWADRYGPRLVIGFGLLALGAGMALLSLTFAIWQLYVFYGVLVALGFAGGAMVPNAALINRWFVKRRGFAITMANTGASLGQLVLIPLAALLIVNAGWRWAYLGLGLLVLAVASPVVWGMMRNSPADLGLLPDGMSISEAAGSVHLRILRTPLGEVLRDRSFWMLTIALMFCGFTVNMVTVHLASYALERGLSQIAAGSAVGLLGGMGLVGMLIAGTASDRLGRKNPLAVIYLIRAVGLILLVSMSGERAFFTAVALVGLSFTVPATLTSALLADKYGSLSVGKLYGLVIMAHQAVGALGVYLGGFFFDLNGTYFWIFLATALATLAGAFSVYLVRETREPLVPVLVLKE